MVSQTILIVDDDQIMVELLAIWLRDAGFAVLTAIDETTAVAALESVAAVAAVVCDFELGQSTGCSVLAKLSKLQPSLVIIMISGHSEHIVRTKCQFSEGHFLQKPFAPADLVALIVA